MGEATKQELQLLSKRRHSTGGTKRNSHSYSCRCSRAKKCNNNHFFDCRSEGLQEMRVHSRRNSSFLHHERAFQCTKLATDIKDSVDLHQKVYLWSGSTTTEGSFVNDNLLFVVKLIFNVLSSVVYSSLGKLVNWLSVCAVSMVVVCNRDFSRVSLKV